VLLETETDTERRENVLAARFRDTERHTAGVGLRLCATHPLPFPLPLHGAVGVLHGRSGVPYSAPYVPTPFSLPPI
jgi:hypothetical protein